MNAENKPNYLVIVLTCSLIALHAYYSTKLEELKDTIAKQHGAINAQNELISIYDRIYTENKNSQINTPYEPKRLTRKESI